MTVTALRPDGTAKAVGASFGGGAASVHGATSDSNLATYAIGTADRGFAWLTLGTTALGALRVRSAQVRVQNGQGTAEAAYQTAWARLRDPTDGTVAGYLQMQRQSTTVSQQRGPLVITGAPGGRAWTQTVLDRMQLEVAWVTSPGGNYLRIHELYVDVDTNAQPTVAAPTITGATSTTRPNVAWVYSDADGDPQTRYRVKIFSAAQYGAAGFTPDGSTATWDSGDQYGSGDTIDLTTDLVNGAYRAYVKAAQDWAGPEGDVWWSAWAFTGFTIAVTPPQAPTLAATLDSTLPGYRVLLDVAAVLNLATLNQSSLETDTAGWAATSNCSISRVTTFSVDGAASLQMSSTAAGTMTAEWSARPTVKAGATYTAAATMRSAVSARTVRVGIRWYDQAGTLIGSTVFGSGLTSATGSNVTPFVTTAAPSNALTAAVVLEVQSTGAGAELHRWDTITLQAGSSTAWAPGGNQGSATVTLERQLRVASGRAAPGNWAHPQLSSGGAITKGTDGFTARTTSFLRSAPMDRPPPGGIANSGARMIVWHPLVGAFNALDFGLPNGVATDDQSPPYLCPAVPGRAQTLSVYLAGSSAVNARIFVYPVDQTNAQVGAGTEVASTTAALPTSGWSRYTATITPPAGTVYLRGAVDLPSGSVDLDVLVTGIQFELGSAASALVPGTGLYFPVWERVREIDTTGPGSPGEHYVAYDHEAPPGDPVLYRARTVVGTLASAPSAVVATLLDPPARNVLKDPLQPENALIVNMAPGWQEQQDADLQVFHPLGRDQVANGTANPLAVRDWLGGQDASYEFAALSDVGLHRLRQLAVPGALLLLQHWEGGQRYLLVTESVGTSRVGPGTFRVSVKAVQTARPI